MRVDNVAVLGDSNNCSKALMAPDETLLCSISRKLVQSEYEQGSFTLRATNISGTARGPIPLPAVETDVSDSVQLKIAQAPQLNVSLVANRTEVYRAGETVQYTITAVSPKSIVCMHFGMHARVGMPNTPAPSVMCSRVGWA
jgi:hypothetical protein